jgi:hypothetical protein
VGDPRYAELLGLDPSIEAPTYWELIGLAHDVSDSEVIEKAYKERMTKIQQIKSSKHKGFIEYLKEELRTAKLTLTNADRRKEYEDKLRKESLIEFKKFVEPLMSMGEVPKKIYDRILQTAQSKYRLKADEAKPIVKAMALAVGANLETEEAAHPAGAQMSNEAISETLDELFADTADGAVDEEAPPPPPPLAPPPAPAEAPLAAPGKVARRSSCVAADAAPPSRPAAETGRPKIQRGGGSFYGGDDGASARPAAEKPAASAADKAAGRRGSYFEAPGEKPPAPWAAAPAAAPAAGRRGASERAEPAAPPIDPKLLEDARRAFNSAIKLAKLGLQAHHELQFYFPPANKANGITPRINGVTYEEVA